MRIRGCSADNASVAGRPGGGWAWYNFAGRAWRRGSFKQLGEMIMAENVYKVIELVGTSSESWEKATAAAITRAGKTLRDLRVAEVVKLDVQLKNGKVEAYRSRISVSFKYESKS
jgi:flavin-binding protein dodecin